MRAIVRRSTRRRRLPRTPFLSTFQITSGDSVEVSLDLKFCEMATDDIRHSCSGAATFKVEGRAEDGESTCTAPLTPSNKTASEVMLDQAAPRQEYAGMSHRL